MAVDYQFEFSFWCLKATIFFGFCTELFFITPMASGVAGRANVGLCPASTFSTL